MHKRVYKDELFSLPRLKFPQILEYPPLHCESMDMLCVLDKSLLASGKICDQSPNNIVSAKAKWQKGVTHNLAIWYPIEYLLHLYKSC